MNGFIGFMSSSAGRVLRMVAGIALIVLALSGQDSGGMVLAVVGLVPLAAGVFDLCLFAPLAGLPLQGAKIRARS